MPSPPDRVTYWPIERAQREWIRTALADIEPEDWLLHGDVDEIPKPAGLRAILKTRDQPGSCLVAQHHAYCLEWLCVDGWRSFVAVRASEAPRSIQAIRNLMAVLPVLDNASWHFSWFGGINANLAKFDSTVHGDIPDKVRADCASGRLIREGWHWQGHWRKLRPYRGTDLPQWVRDGKEPRSWHQTSILSDLNG